MATITGISHIDLTVTDLDRSEDWYAELLGMKRVLDGRNDARHFDSRYLVHPDSMLIIGLVHHDDTRDNGAGGAFDEHCVGLDHLSFNVASRAELDDWQTRVAERAIDHTPIVESDMWDVLVVRDPDNIQLEFFYMKPAAASLLA
jgi:catechol 2,3-dioxygenase-like lactoylglutathione lyase family enzyme